MHIIIDFKSKSNESRNEKKKYSVINHFYFDYMYLVLWLTQKH